MIIPPQQHQETKMIIADQNTLLNDKNVLGVTPYQGFY